MVRIIRSASLLLLLLSTLFDYDFYRFATLAGGEDAGKNNGSIDFVGCSLFYEAFLLRDFRFCYDVFFLRDPMTES